MQSDACFRERCKAAQAIVSPRAESHLNIKHIVHALAFQAALSDGYTIL